MLRLGCCVTFCCIAGPQYGTVERAWCALMTEAEKVSDLHMEMKGVLMSEDFEKVKNWQKDAYHKQMIGGFKETKEAEDGFRKAQKPWAKKLKEVQPHKECFPNHGSFFKDIIFFGYLVKILTFLSWLFSPYLPA